MEAKTCKTEWPTNPEFQSLVEVASPVQFYRFSAIMEAFYYILLVISEYLCYVHAEKLIGKQKKNNKPLTSLGKFEISTHFIRKLVL